MLAHVLSPFSRLWDIQNVQLLIAGSIPCLHTYQTYHSHWKPSICHRQYVPLQYSKTHAFFLCFLSHVHQFHGHVHISTASKLLFRKIDKHIDSRDLQMNQGQASHLKQILQMYMRRRHFLMDRSWPHVTQVLQRNLHTQWCEHISFT